MNRTRTYVKSLTMINWRGIPFQIIDMDRLITALEGKNAAGKTTVLTAFYVSLLPDKSLVKIPNVGDTEGQGRESGLHGKLGNAGPVYAILELINPLEERIIAGVQLYARTAPQVEMDTTFVVKNLPAHVPIERILTFEKDAEMFIPEISQINQKVGVYGGDMEKFNRIGDYGTALFDLGVLPVNLSDRKSRENFNRFLQTSLLGGFSKSLQERLKDYLLSEDTKTRDGVQNMQENLDRCRKTKKHLESLNGKIASVVEIYSTSREMMKALVHGLRLKEQQVKEEAEKLWDVCVDARKKYTSQIKAYKAVTEDYDGIKASIAENERKQEEAKTLLNRTQEAFDLEAKLAQDRSALSTLQDALAAAKSTLDVADEKYQSAVSKIGTLSAQMLDLSNRLASAEEAWRKISKEAGLYQMACECLDGAKKAMPKHDVSAASARALQTECRTKKEDLSRAVSGINQKLQNATQFRTDFLTALHLLIDICDKTVQAEGAWEEALAIEKEYRDLAEFVSTNKALPEKIASVKVKAEAQGAIREKLLPLKEKGIIITSKTELLAAHANVAGEVEQLGEDVRSKAAEIAALENKAEQLAETKTVTAGMCAPWDKAVALRKELEEQHGVSFGTKGDVEVQIGSLSQQKDKLIGKQSADEAQIKELDKKISDLINRENTVDARLEKLEKELDGKLVISLYEDIEIKEASEKEARLGPLVNAIMVDDVPSALQKIEQMNVANLPEELWLLEKSKLDTEVLRFYRRVGESIVAQMDKAWRVTQFPERPVIGLQARRKLISEYRSEKDRKQSDLKTTREGIKTLEAGISRLRQLVEEFRILSAANPYDVIADLEMDISAAKQDISTKRAELGILTHCRDLKVEIANVLKDLIPEGYLLGEEDHQQKLAELQELLKKVDAANLRWEAKRHLLNQFSQRIQSLRVLPPTEAECEEMRTALETHNTEWQFWDDAENAVNQLVQKLADFQYEASFELLQKSEDPARHLRNECQRVQALYAEEGDRLSDLKNEQGDAQAKYSEVLAIHDNKKREIVQDEEKLQGVDTDGSANALETAKRQHLELTGARNKLNAEFKGLDESKSNLRSGVQTAKDKVRDARAAWHTSRMKHLPVRETLAAGEHAFSSDRTLHALLPAADSISEFRSAAVAFDEAKRMRGSLEASVKHQTDKDKDSEIFATGLKVHLATPLRFSEHGEEQKMLQNYLDLWKEVVIYISGILPRDCVYTDNPEAAIEQMNDRYKSLSETLEQQEKDFQADSRDVANSIRSRIKTERTNIRKINTILDGMSFGNIQSICVEFTTNDEMMEILDAMQNKEQWDLFAEDLPLMEAMKKIYAKKVGGKVQGDELLDYKKYISLNVKILRKSATEWESSFMSTGEAIGTGSAILMVILMTWERNASFFKSKDMHNTLRFLFMDEATRLDSESIKTLVDFCEKFKIQFLLAGPKFEDEECGSGTTYRLVRTNVDGRESVIIRGRRGFGGSVLSGEEAA